MSIFLAIQCLCQTPKGWLLSGHEYSEEAVFNPPPKAKTKKKNSPCQLPVGLFFLVCPFTKCVAFPVSWLYEEAIPITPLVLYSFQWVLPGFYTCWFSSSQGSTCAPTWPHGSKVLVYPPVPCSLGNGQIHLQISLGVWASSYIMANFSPKEQ